MQIMTTFTAAFGESLDVVNFKIFDVEVLVTAVTLAVLVLVMECLLFGSKAGACPLRFFKEVAKNHNAPPIM